MTTFAMALAKKPISAQKRGKKRRYQQEIREAAMLRVGKAKLPLLDGELYARITWFHAAEPKLDVDNIVKPIFDALVGIVYDDDHHIAQCVITRVRSRPQPDLSDEHILPDLYSQLKKLIRNHPHVLYIEVGQLSLSKVIFGPTDGG